MLARRRRVTHDSRGFDAESKRPRHASETMVTAPAGTARSHQIARLEGAQYVSRMRGRRHLFVASLVAAVHVATGCSGDEHHAPFANDTCTHPPCGVPAVVSGGQSSAGGAAATDGGITVDASANNCFTETASGLKICKGSTLCPGYVLDTGLWPDCGFVSSGATASEIDVECVCRTQNVLCPVSVMSTCAAMMLQVTNNQSEDNLCTNLSASSFATCRDLNSVSPTGIGGAGGAANCDQNCIATCANAPACVAGCCTNP
jgi:hypothetical protein